MHSIYGKKVSLIPLLWIRRRDHFSQVHLARGKNATMKCISSNGARPWEHSLARSFAQCFEMHLEICFAARWKQKCTYLVKWENFVVRRRKGLRVNVTSLRVYRRRIYKNSLEIKVTQNFILFNKQGIIITNKCSLVNNYFRIFLNY